MTNTDKEIDDILDAARPFFVGRDSHHHHTHSTTIVEKRAPTDESVALLREMEKAARDKIESAIRVESNGFECVAHTMHDCMSNDIIIKVLFSLAGKRMSVEHRCKRLHDQSALEGLHKAISDRIAEEVICDIAKALQPVMVSRPR